MVREIDDGVVGVDVVAGQRRVWAHGQHLMGSFLFLQFLIFL
jgi:hypothetical protein